MKIWTWLKGLFSHPKTTAAGVLQTAAGAAIAAGMATGKVPVTAENIGLSGGLVAGGLGNISAKDANKASAVVASATTAASAVVPVVMSMDDHYNAVLAQIGQAQTVLASATEANTVVSAMLGAVPEPITTMQDPLGPMGPAGPMVPDGALETR